MTAQIIAISIIMLGLVFLTRERKPVPERIKKHR